MDTSSAQSTEAASNGSLPLYVDLDGTLVLSDLMIEQFLALMKAQPWRWPQALLWLSKGRAHFKQEINRRVRIDPATLPYNQPLLEDLNAQAKTGRSIFLATGSDQGIANEIAEHLNLFEGVLSSDGEKNLIGKTKLAAIVNHANSQPFAYAGDSRQDIPILENAAQSYLVNPNAKLMKAASQQGQVAKIYGRRSSSWRAIVRAIRPHQWVKNLLLFVPLFSAHAYSQLTTWRLAMMAFFSFCAVASATYLINDLLDLQSDRHHPMKRNRPFASGAVSIKTGLAIIPVLILLGFATGSLAGRAFLVTLILYFFISQLYSFYLKTVQLLDVTALAGLFTLRVFSGAYAIQVPISQWLLAFSMFTFFSLAFVKRYAELHNLKSRGGDKTPGRGYRVSDIDQLALFGVVSGFMSVLVLALYVSSPEVERLYSHPHLLMLACPVYLIWINWIWMAAKRGKMHEDPILFAFKDPGSYAAGICVLVSVLISL